MDICWTPFLFLCTNSNTKELLPAPGDLSLCFESVSLDLLGCVLLELGHPEDCVLDLLVILELLVGIGNDILEDIHYLVLSRFSLDAELCLDLVKIREDRSKDNDIILCLVIDAGYYGLNDIRRLRKQRYSISSGNTFLPFLAMMTFFLRPVMMQKPSSSI